MESISLNLVIKKARHEQGLTQKNLAEKAGTNRTYVSLAEMDVMNVSVSVLRKIVETGLGGKLELGVKF